MTRSEHSLQKQIVQLFRTMGFYVFTITYRWVYRLSPKYINLFFLPIGHQIHMHPTRSINRAF